jgi:hypothetical protein
LLIEQAADPVDILAGGRRQYLCRNLLDLSVALDIEVVPSVRQSVLSDGLQPLGPVKLLRFHEMAVS